MNHFLKACRYECANLDTGYYTTDCDKDTAEALAVSAAQAGHILETWLVDPYGQRLYTVHEFRAENVTIH